MRGVDRAVAYAWQPGGLTAAVGLSQDVNRELCMDAVEEEGVPILRRASGGGAVLLTEGVLCFGVISPVAAIGEDNGIHAAYRVLTAHVCDALAGLGIRASVQGVSDIAAPASDPSESTFVKLAGTAQLRKRNAVLVHGSVLVAADLTLLDQYLGHPSKEPGYRRQRSHQAFCKNVNDFLAEPVTPRDLYARIRRQAKDRKWVWEEVPFSLDADAKSLLQEKYLTDAWARHRIRP